MVIEMSIKKSPRFYLGQCVATPGAMEAMNELTVSPAELLERHVTGDWGDLSESDKMANEAAVVHEDDPDQQQRVFSAYVYSGQKLWVITEWDRSATTILLPEEY